MWRRRPRAGAPGDHRQDPGRCRRWDEGAVGGPGRGRSRGGPAGDLYVEVHEKPHDVFIRDGDDLHFTVRVPMVEAALGTSVSVEAILDGDTVIRSSRACSPGRW